MRKHFQAVLLLVLVTLTSAGKSQDISEYHPSFSAVVVKNIDASEAWYKAIFGLSTRDVMNDPNNNYRVRILESPSYVLELLELKGSLPHDDVLKGKPAGTQLQGHFKIGFKVSDMDRCLKTLAGLKVDVPQVWTDPKTNKRNFLVKDPDGNLVQFFE